MMPWYSVVSWSEMIAYFGMPCMAELPAVSADEENVKETGKIRNS
jgi:hypothetical protein